MVLDILAAIGLKETGKYVAKDVLLPLLQGSLEDYAKDFFKGCIADAAGLASQAPVQKALGEALKAFVELVEEELKFQGCSGAEIRDFYEIPLREFMKDKDVKATLGKAFEPDCRAIDAEMLALRWDTLELRPLPEEFDWPQIGKQYVRAVKGILRSSDELRDLLKLHNQEAMRQGIEELVGIPPDFDLQKYQETLREQYGNLKLESLDTSAYAYNDLKLWRMFIPQDVRTCQEFNPKVYEIPKEKLKELQQRGELDAEALEAAQIEAYRQTYVEQPIQNVLEVVGRTAGVGQRSRPVADCAVVLGDPGSGKSTLLQYVALQWAEQPIRDLKELTQRPLPLLIELRKYARDRNDQKCSSMVEYLHQGDIACRLNQQRLHEVLLAGDAIALFDGIDEVFDPNLRDVVVTDIHRFTNDYPPVQVVVTSRWLGYKAQTLRDAGFQHYMLQDLTDEQIAEFIARWHDQTFPEGADKVRKRERLHKAIRESKAIRELAGNPLLLTMMAILNRNQELPRDRPELYNQASRVLLHQWDVERNLIEQKLDPVTIDYRDKQAMLRKVAYHMQSGEAGLAGNIISAQDLEAILTDYLKAIDVDQPRDVARRMIQQLRTRNFILCYLGADNYAFVHRTFLEFFAAWAFVWEFKETQTITFEKLRDQTFGAHWQEESWQEVLRLIAGMIEAKFVGSLTTLLLDQKVDKVAFSNGGSLEREGLSNLLLAANCLSEVRNRKELTTQADQLFQRLKAEVEDQYPYNLDRNASDAVVGAAVSAWREHINLLPLLKSWIRVNPDSYIPEAVVAAIAQNWFTASDTLPWLKTRAQSDENYAVRMAAVQELAKGFKDDPETLLILKTRAQSDENYDVRMAAVQELAKGFKDDPETLPWLKTRAQSDENYAVRRAAVQELAKGFKDDPETLPWLKTRAQSDENYAVRRAAVQELAKGFKDDPETLPWLKTRAQSDENYAVRRAAVQELAKGFKDDPETLPILKTRAQSDENYAVRMAAVQELAKGFKDDPETLLILKTRAQSDENYAVRRAAVQELAKGFKDDPETLPWLKTRAQSDENYAVRRAAVQELAKGFNDDPETLLILKTRAQSDEDNAVRMAAVQELAKGFKDDLNLFELWCDRALNDPFEREYEWDDNPRQTALNVLVQQHPGHPKTLELLQDRAQNDNDVQLREWAAEQLEKLKMQN
ncbi:HEAT repeat domain-containing protein [Nodosilinea sp. E11]|uniref:HEAT repeat domain-containing protein n=1 Tax=Nodosilinea sp. E11 TaxID=3037479 RepID=UPI002934FF69|nr:HEAT repeat domain-containing protein [Nodosilinea sp. E11]WOD37516.1 HEAT repeat domain-containing protein [Nodosilinea sp. E11]